MKERKKVKILKMVYEEEDHIFIMEMRDSETGQDVNLAMRAEDFNIDKSIPVNIINDFCTNMEGKEKNLFVEEEKDQMLDVCKRNNGKLSEQEVEKLHGDMDKYPYKELVRKQLAEKAKNESKDIRGK